MKLNEITIDDIKTYCGISDSDSDDILNKCFESAVAYAVSYTGHSKEELNEFDDVVVAILVLTNDYYLFRRSGMENIKINPTVENILHLHCVNFL